MSIKSLLESLDNSNGHKSNIFLKALKDADFSLTIKEKHSGLRSSKISPKEDSNVTNPYNIRSITDEDIKKDRVINIKTGANERITIESELKRDKDEDYREITARNYRNEIVGLARLIDDPEEEVKDFLGMCDQKSLYIDFWATSPIYKGIGKVMIKKIVEISKQKGYNGKVSINASSESIPIEFLRICGYNKTQDVSCALKCRKIGFVSANPELNLKISHAILKGESGLKLQMCTNGTKSEKVDEFAGKMELSQQAVKKYLELNEAA